MNLDTIFGHTPKIYNLFKDKNIPDDVVNCMRPNKFGNPFKALSEKDRDIVCDLFEKYCEVNESYRADIKKELKGRDLGCCCFPKRCHCMTLLRIANEKD